MTRDTEGFSHFVTSMTAPVASGWSDGRVGFAPTGKAPPYHGAHPERALVNQVNIAHEAPVAWQANGAAVLGGMGNAVAVHNRHRLCIPRAGRLRGRPGTICRLGVNSAGPN